MKKLLLVMCIALASTITKASEEKKALAQHIITEKYEFPISGKSMYIQTRYIGPNLLDQGIDAENEKLLQRYQQEVAELRGKQRQQAAELRRKQQQQRRSHSGICVITTDDHPYHAASSSE